MARGGKGPGSSQREHHPHELGPRLFRRGAWWQADLRPWGGGRVVLRDPRAPTWPGGGARTQDRAEADRWKWRYVEHLEDQEKRERLGLHPRFRNLQEAVAAYLVHRRNTVEPNTVASDRTGLGHLVDLVGDGAPVDVVTSQTIQRLVDKRLSQGYAATTLRTTCITISGFARWLQLPSIWDGLSLPDPGRVDVQTWKSEELEELRKAADWIDAQARPGFQRTRLALEAALATGARQGELFALEWGSFDPVGRTVRIHRQLARDLQSFKPLKGKLGRTAAVLPEWWAFHQDRPGLVFQGRKGGPVTSRPQRGLITRLLDVARLNGPGLGWHSFRHTYARRFIEMGARLEELQQSLGHASIRITERAYGHFRPDVAARSAVAEIYRGEPLRVVQGGQK